MDYIPTSEKGANSGVATLGSDGKVPSTQLPAMNYAPSTHASQHASGGSDAITPESIGAAPSGHTHDDRYYTESEVNNLLAGKQDASSAINTGNIGSQSVNYANSAGNANSVGGMPFINQDGGGNKAYYFGFDGGANTVYAIACGNMSVGYANSAGNSDTVDGWHMNLDPGSWGIKPIYAGTGDMVAGSTALSNGHIYLVYE